MDSKAWYDFAEIVKEIKETIKNSTKENSAKENSDGLDQVEEPKFHFTPLVEHEIRRIVREEIRNMLKENDNLNKKILEYKKMERYI